MVYHTDLHAKSKWADILLGEFVAPKDSQSPVVMLFDALKDADRMMVYNPDWKHRPVDYPSAERATLKFSMPGDQAIPMLGFQAYFGDRMENADKVDTLVIKARTTEATPFTIQIGLIDAQGDFFATGVELKPEFQTIKIPFSMLKPAAQLLLPRPYPGFQKLYHRKAIKASFELAELEKLEITFGKGLELSTIYLK